MRKKEIDKDLINAKFDIIEKNLELLDEIGSENKEDFVKNFRDIQATKHALQESIESCIDISNHIISRRRLERAESYTEIFEILDKNEIITKKLSLKLQAMTKFRNLLVHQYGRVNEEELFSIIKEDIKDIEEFQKQIIKFLEN
ncbi:DUF86 domain-containing protein [Candidatus Woesearchaeota archaeon]|nr:DUF86 domain-containing protein [Candidatus Woesearchaeota archaeon]